MLDDLLIHQTYIAILLLPLVPLAVLAAAGSAPASRRACRQVG
jgi:hypothetical protein